MKLDITELQDSYILCRTLGHAWEDFPNGEPHSDWARSAQGILMLRCTRCTTQRFDYFGRHNEIIYRNYVYPEQYASIPGQGTRPNLRGELFRRSLLIHHAQKRRNRNVA
jgi:hypothetical protein